MLYPRIEDGPTTFAFTMYGAIIVAVDHARTTAGSRPASESLPENVMVLNSFTLATISGDGDVCDSFPTYLEKKICSNECGQERLISAKEASSFLSRSLSCCIEKGLSGVIFAGWENMAPVLYHVDGDGNLSEGDLFATGSGKEFAAGGIRGRSCLIRDPKSIKEAAELARDVMVLTAYRARESHGYVSVFCVRPDGWETVIREEDIAKHLEDSFSQRRNKPDSDDWEPKSPTAEIDYEKLSFLGFDNTG